MASKAALKALRKKYGLGEYARVGRRVVRGGKKGYRTPAGFKKTRVMKRPGIHPRTVKRRPRGRFKRASSKMYAFSL